MNASPPSPRFPRRVCPLRAPVAAAVALIVSLSAGAQGPDAADHQDALQLAMAAQRASQAGDYQSAVAGYRAALQQRPDLQRARFELARVLAFLGQLEEAATEFGRVVEATPENGAARRGEVTALLLLERYADARRRLEEGLVALPRDGQLAHTLARLLASAPLDDVRDGPLAVQLASTVYEVKKILETGETLAMAWAEVGEFDRAVALQRQLLEQAEAADNASAAEALRQRLLSYLRREPWRATSAAEIALATEPPAPPGQAP